MLMLMLLIVHTVNIHLFYPKKKGGGGNFPAEGKDVRQHPIIFIIFKKRGDIRLKPLQGSETPLGYPTIGNPCLRASSMV